MLCRLLVVSTTLAFVCRVRLIALVGLGPLWWVGPNMWAIPNEMYGMRYFGELSKLCAYGFMVTVLGTFGSKGKIPT